VARTEQLFVRATAIFGDNMRYIDGPGNVIGVRDIKIVRLVKRGTQQYYLETIKEGQRCQAMMAVTVVLGRYNRTGGAEPQVSMRIVTDLQEWWEQTYEGMVILGQPSILFTTRDLELIREHGKKELCDLFQ
jgi:hypothetical protein